MGNNVSGPNILITFYENMNMDTFYNFENFPFDLYFGIKPIIFNKYYSYVINGTAIISNNLSNIKIHKIYLTDENIDKKRSFQLIYMIEDEFGNLYKPQKTFIPQIDKWIELIYTWVGSLSQSVLIPNMKERTLEIFCKRKIYFEDDLLNPYAEIYDNISTKIMLIEIYDIYKYDKNFYYLKEKYIQKQIAQIKYYFMIVNINYNLVFYDDYFTFELFDKGQTTFRIAYFYNTEKIIFNYSKWFFSFVNSLNLKIRKGLTDVIDKNLNFPEWINETTYWAIADDMNYFTDNNLTNIIDVSSIPIFTQIFDFVKKLHLDLNYLTQFEYPTNSNQKLDYLTVDMLIELKTICENIKIKIMEMETNPNSSLNILLKFMKNFKYTDIDWSIFNNQMILDSQFVNFVNKYYLGVENSEEVIVIARFDLNDLYLFEVKTIQNNTLICYYIKITHQKTINGNTLINFPHTNCLNDSSCCKKYILDNYIVPMIRNTYLNKSIVYFDQSILMKECNNVSRQVELDYWIGEHIFNFV